MITICENKIGLKHQDEGLPCSTAVGSFSREGGRYHCRIVTEYKDPFASFRNELPQAVVEMFKILVEENDFSDFFGTDSLGEEFFFDLAVKTDLLLAEMAPHDTDTAGNFSMACALIDTAVTDTKIACRGRIHVLITDKVSGEIDHIWPKKDCAASLSAFSFALSPDNNIFLCNESFYRNIYNTREKIFYAARGKAICVPLSEPFFFETLDDMAYIAIDLGAKEYGQDAFPSPVRPSFLP